MRPRSSSPNWNTRVATWAETAEKVAGVLADETPSVEARVEAWRIVCGVTGRSVESVMPLRARDAVPDSDVRAIESAVARLRRGEPCAYVLGRVPFHDVDVAVDARALIPRPETEALVDAVVGWCRERKHLAPRMLDLGTGTGCIALALARTFPSASIVATDACRRTLGLAAENLRASPYGKRVRLVCADWLRWTNASWDVIVSNPPYIARHALVELPASVREWEPRVALDGGVDGRAHLDALIADARYHLAPRGLLALELSPEQADGSLAWAARCGYEEARILADYAKTPRILMATVKGASC